MGSLLVYFYWLHSVDKNTAISRTPYFQKIYCRIFIPEWKGLNKARSAQNITKNERFWWRKYSGDFSPQQNRFSLYTVLMARSSVQTQVTESQSSIPVRTAHWTWTTESSCSQPVRIAQRMRTNERTCLQGCPDAKVKIVDGEAFPCNRLDARSSCSDALQQNIWFAITRPDERWPIRRS